MTIAGKLERLEENSVQSIEFGIGGERRPEIWPPGTRRVVTPTLSSFDKIETACRDHSQVEQEVSGLGRSSNTRPEGFASDAISLATE